MSCLFLAGISVCGPRVPRVRRVGETANGGTRAGGRVNLTNKLNLPQPIYDAVKNDEYTRGDADISVTALLSPARIVALREKHESEIVEDASERIFSLMGQCMHTVLERADKTGVTERRLSIEVEGWKVSGQVDRYEDGVVQDYKFVTAWKFKDLTVPPEYEQQLNVYAEILRVNGHKVTKLQIVGILRDWSKLEAMRDQNYPQRQIVVRTVNLWPASQAQEFMRERVILHKQARLSLPECSPEDRWKKADVWAVMKHGAVRAIKLFENPVDADALAATNEKYYVQVRPGEAIRCRAYCAVSSFCTQYQAEIQPEKEEDIA